MSELSFHMAIAGAGKETIERPTTHDRRGRGCSWRSRCRARLEVRKRLLVNANRCISEQKRRRVHRDLSLLCVTQEGCHPCVLKEVEVGQHGALLCSEKSLVCAR
jgi:hypothetical protein